MEVIRKVMDVLLSQNFLVEGAPATRFYVPLLGFLHLVLTNAKGFQNDHVPAFVATLRMFFTYGLSQPLYSTNAGTHKNAAKLISEDTKKERIPYRPPHLRRKENVNMKQLKAQELSCSSLPLIKSLLHWNLFHQIQIAVTVMDLLKIMILLKVQKSGLLL
ncbi:unnamed protein product [Linum tenue]|uniref:Uncharacterized protein n=1 Tax=Linum tenue TaxID=586396 RepID=A0AAV0RAF0_9ROSI|nr:unnamed protein product [Linum tenue]